MSTPSSSYAEILVSQGYGLPLWFPEPGNQGDVEIGDVGFISEGRFIRIFNAMLSSADPLNARGVPDDFTALKVDEGHHLEFHTQLVPPGSVSTPSIHYEDSAQADTSDRHRFSWIGQRSAIALILDSGQEQFVTGQAIRQYIHRHHPSWYSFAQRKDYDLREEEIIFVYGWVKTSRWALATFNRSKRESAKTVSLCATPYIYNGDIFTFDRTTNSMISVDQRSCPGRSMNRSVQQVHATIDQPKDQTLFLKYYKLRRRRFLGNRPPISDDERNTVGTLPTPHSTSAISSLGRQFRDIFLGKKLEAEEILYKEHQDPLDDALSYILKYSSADVAIVNHEDLYRVFSPSEWPRNVSKHLHQAKPGIVVDQYGGMLNGAKNQNPRSSKTMMIFLPTRFFAAAFRRPRRKLSINKQVNSDVAGGSDVPPEYMAAPSHGRMKPFTTPVAEETEASDRPRALPIEAVSESSPTTQILPASPDDVFSDAQLASRFGLTYSPEAGMRRGTAETSNSVDSKFSSGGVSEKSQGPIEHISETTPGCACTVM